ncbi:hypothetical protein [Bradyrhizobium sp. S3.9.1]|uniref:hypothetical protein n=1 Tax=Bradyrhizobium sp. S3.9.1 TaxID=3156431 RepID=UPI003390B8EE
MHDLNHATGIEYDPKTRTEADVLSEFEFEEVATSVEERFRRAYDVAKVGSARVESQMEYELVSLGWWLVIKRLGLALWIGKDKPAIESGDLLNIKISKRHLPHVQN